MAETQAGAEVAQALPGRLRPVWEECRAALAGLAGCSGDPAELVHVLRRRGKRLRGGLWLVGAPRQVRAELRDLGRILGPARDAAVRAATLARLLEPAGEGMARDLGLGVAVALLAEEASLGEGTPPAPVLEFAAERLAAVGAWLGPDPPLARGWEQRLGGMRARAEKHLARLAKGKGTGAARLHAARKAIKRWHGAAWFLLPETDPATAKRLKRLLALADELGEVQDLHLLRVWLDGCGLTRQRLPGLHRAIRDERRRLLGRIRRRAARHLRRAPGRAAPDPAATPDLSCPAAADATPTSS